MDSHYQKLVKMHIDVEEYYNRGFDFVEVEVIEDIHIDPMKMKKLKIHNGKTVSNSKFSKVYSPLGIK